MFKITFYGYDQPLVIMCKDYLEALYERNLRSGMGLSWEIEQVPATDLHSELKI